MKFLFDQNLSPRLVQTLASLFPGSIHVRDIGLERSDDQIVWDYALTHGFAIVTKDAGPSSGGAVTRTFQPSP